MATVFPAGSVNPNQILAPGVYVQAILPSAPVSGVPTNIVGIVGTSPWGPVNNPITIGGLQEYIFNFGTVLNETFDMGTQLYAGTSVGASNFLCVRVTDGTDVKATVDVNDTAPAIGMTLTAKYSGTVGNSINVFVEDGTNTTIANPTYKVTIVLPTGTGSNVPEIYDNIGGTGAALWQNIVNAINLGQGDLVPPSELVTAAIGVGTAAPALTSYVLAGGTNGNSGVTDSDVLGSDTLPLTGMYALSDTNVDLIVLAGVTDSTTWVAQATFAAGQGAYAMLAAPFGDSYATTIAAKKTAGLDSYAAKLFPGDNWIKIQDSFNNVQRYIPQQGLIAGLFSVLPIQDSGLNKIIDSSILVSTYYADQDMRYTSADIIAILSNGLDVVANPAPGGTFYWALQTGKNTSSNILVSSDSYARLTGYLAGSIQSLLAPYIGQLQSEAQRRSAKTKLDAFLANLARLNVIGSSNGGQAFSVVINNSNNPPAQVATGIEVVNVSVAYLQTISALLVNLKGGLTVISVKPA